MSNPKKIGVVIFSGMECGDRLVSTCMALCRRRSSQSDVKNFSFTGLGVCRLSMESGICEPYEYR